MRTEPSHGGSSGGRRSATGSVTRPRPRSRPGPVSSRPKSGPLLDATLVWSVEKVNAKGSAEIRQTFEHVHEEMTERSPGGVRMVYDSGNPKSVDNPWSAMKDALYRPLIGAPYRLKVDRQGSIIDITLPDAVRKGWQELSLQPRDDRDYLFTKAGMRSLLSAMPELPGRPIARGETWRHRREVASESPSNDVGRDLLPHRPGGTIGHVRGYARDHPAGRAESRPRRGPTGPLEEIPSPRRCDRREAIGREQADLRSGRRSIGQILLPPSLRGEVRV